MARKRRRRTPRPPLMQRLRNDFLAGLVVVLPLFLTGYLLYWTIDFVDAKVIPLIPRAYNPENVFGRNIFGLGLLLFLSFTTIVGAFAKNLVGKSVLGFGERILERTPIVRPIYNGLKQIAETLFTQTGTTFEGACLVEYPRKGVWSVAFISSRVRTEIRERSGEDELVSVFLPMTPNPTAGFLRFVPRRDIVLLDMSLEDAAKLIISGGLVTEPAQSASSRTARGRSAVPAPSPAPTRTEGGD